MKFLSKTKSLLRLFLNLYTQNMKRFPYVELSMFQCESMKFFDIFEGKILFLVCILFGHVDSSVVPEVNKRLK